MAPRPGRVWQDAIRSSLSGSRRPSVSSRSAGSARFWERMTLTGFVLGAMALANEPELRHTRWRKRDLAYGLG
jgi:hypothetical protein